MAGAYMIAYHLSMPGVASWNGKWSGEDRLWVICRPMRGAARLSSIIEGQPYHYDFGDGWRAMVRCEHVTGDVARKLRRKSAGFAGYEWMIDEIQTYGRIKRLDER